MSKTIWKYELEPSTTLEMPVGAKILHVHEQNDVMCLWALVDTEAPLEVRTFSVYGTGHPMHNHPMEYIGTAHLSGGSLVLHVFEDGPRKSHKAIR